MKNLSLKKPQKHYLAFIALFLVIVFLEQWIVSTSHFYQNRLLPLAVSIDLIIILPVLYFFVIVKPLKVNKLSLLGVIMACMGVGYGVIPKGYQEYLYYAEIGLIILELGVLVWVLTKIHKIIKEYQKLEKETSDFIKNVHQAFETHLGNSFFIHFFVSELIMLRYGLFFWIYKKRDTQENEFTIHKESAFVPTFSVLIFVSLIELVVVHILLMDSKPILTWILTALSVYSLVFLMAYIVSIVRRKISIEQNTVFIRVGKVWNFEIDKSNISEIIPIKDVEKDKNILNVASLLMTQPNVLIKLHKKISIRGLYGIKKEINQVALVLDKPQDFIKLS
ncbi:hypothetical protein AD998_08895 [bacterium 336/3]|nr:hypothetical protein AD998_08895 [bacterium 336/3]